MRPHTLTAAFDNTKLLAAENVVDEVIEVARLRGVEVLIIKRREDLLAQYAGIAAIQYAVPLEAAAVGGQQRPDALRQALDNKASCKKKPNTEGAEVGAGRSQRVHPHLKV